VEITELIAMSGVVRKGLLERAGGTVAWLFCVQSELDEKQITV
jgi:hypothetical protein